MKKIKIFFIKLLVNHPYLMSIVCAELLLVFYFLLQKLNESAAGFYLGAMLVSLMLIIAFQRIKLCKLTDYFFLIKKMAEDEIAKKKQLEKAGEKNE